MPIETLSLARATRITTILEIVPDSVCIIDDFNLRWPEVRPEQKATAFCAGESVYHYLPPQTPLPVIDKTLRMADCIWHGVAAMCRHPLQLTPEGEADPEALRDCIRAVIEFTCVAYDGEGFVGWRRKLAPYLP